jgi:hypothetical protein
LPRSCDQLFELVCRDMASKNKVAAGASRGGRECRTSIVPPGVAMAVLRPESELADWGSRFGALLRRLFSLISGSWRWW